MVGKFKNLIAISLFYSIVTDLAQAQTPKTLKECWTSSLTAFWCVPKDGSIIPEQKG